MTTPTFCNELTWMTWKVCDQVGLVFKGAGESEEPLVCLLLCMIGKVSDLSNFDKGKIAMDRGLATGISETARLVRCS